MTALKVLGKKIIVDGKVSEASDFHSGMSADTYYEVVRLIDGKFLFLQDHLDRLKHSLSGSDIPYPGDGILRRYLGMLLENNEIQSGNVRICMQKKPEDRVRTCCYFISYFYPSPPMYSEGVKLLTFPYVRSSPGIKRWDGIFRESVGGFIRENGIYEAALVNSKKQVTEGSRSNIFFIDRDNRLVSAPENEMLSGITRKYVLRICREEGIPVMERPVHLKELDKMSACFITGTSPKILPVWQLDGFLFDVAHPLLSLLMERFDQILQENLEHPGSYSSGKNQTK
ncbi:MAG: aminotransferase class IV [Bacteroidales bacterium]